MENPAHPNVISYLERHGLEHQVLPCDPELADTRSYCEHYACPLEEAANVLLIASKKGDSKLFL